MIKTLASTIIWIAQERLRKGEKYQNLNSAIHAVILDTSQIIMDFMKENRERSEDIQSCDSTSG